MKTYHACMHAGRAKFNQLWDGSRPRVGGCVIGTIEESPSRTPFLCITRMIFLLSKLILWSIWWVHCAHHDYLITRPDIWFCFSQFNLLRNWYWMLTDFLFTGRSLYPKGKQERDGQWHNNHKTVSCLWLFQNEDNSVSLKYDLFLSVLRSQMHVILRLPKSS